MKEVKFTYMQFRAKSPSFTSAEVRELASAIRDEALYEDGEDSGLLDLFYPVRNYWEGQTLALADSEGKLLKQIDVVRSALKAGVFVFMGNNQCSTELGNFLTEPIEQVVNLDKKEATRKMLNARIELLELVRENLLKIADAIDAGQPFANFNRTIINGMTSF